MIQKYMKLKSLFKSKIFLILLTALLLRVALSFFGTLRLDFNTFIAWSNRLVELPLSRFYEGWCDYLPGYMYILWLLRIIKNLIPVPDVVLYKLPAIFSDIATGYLIYKIVNRLGDKKAALIASLLYTFNPAIIANSTLWGQVDSVTAFFSLLAVYLASSNLIFSAVSLAVGAAVKPQAALALLAIFFVMIRDKWKIRKIILYGVIGLLVFILLFIPFSDGNIIQFVFSRLTAGLSQYPYTSVNAFNFWGFFGFWKPETGIIPPNILGVAITLVVGLIASAKLLNKKGGEYLLLAVLFLANFFFFTRMHERHLLAAFAPLVVFAVSSASVFIPYVFLSLAYIANLYYSYIWITKDFLNVFSLGFIRIIIFSSLVSFFYILIKILETSNKDVGLTVYFEKLAGYWKKYSKGSDRKSMSFDPVNVSGKALGMVMWAIFIFAFVFRVIGLSNPPKEYFDEVYHAFTAKLVLHADNKAWEWWNPHPEGFAYEWTHPPVAKLAMAVGMKIFGENSFGWRVPSAFLGALSTLIIYGIALKLFKDRFLAVLASVVYSLDGLVLAMARIGMNDTYFVFFTLLSVFLFLRKKDFLSSLSFGLAIASKWSAIWAAPIIGLIWLSRKKKSILAPLLFLIVPVAIYLASYFQLFTTGHGIDVFWGMQKQMWWYHTGLKATHPYTSAWWSWPLLVRPVYLYTSDEVVGWVARIYNLGNPAVFWFGLTSVILSFIYSFVERNKKLALVVFSYLIFFVPWAASPRIMFFYHYLPSLPFLSIATAYVLRRNMKIIPYFLTIAFILFIYFYPHWAGIKIPLWLDTSYYWFSSWR